MGFGSLKYVLRSTTAWNFFYQIQQALYFFYMPAYLHQTFDYF